MLLRPPAKINLTLSVGPRGEDDFHPLQSIFMRVGLSDELAVDLAPAMGSDKLTVEGDDRCPVEGNLVLRAFSLVRSAIGHEMPPLVAHLTKHIPIGAGLGGGSSDGALAVEAALELWGVGLSPQVRAQIELDLGADVPFFAHGGPAARVTGRGEKVEPLPVPDGVAGVLLVTPAVRLSTAQVFARFDELDPPQATSRHDANDLWAAAASLAPGLAALREYLEAETARPWLLSGSGSTLFALYPSVAEATAAGRLIASAESELLEGAIINAVNTEGPDPNWRYP